MQQPNDHQIAVADAEGTLREIGALFDIHFERVRQLRLHVGRYRDWKYQSDLDAALPLAQRRVEFMPLSRRVRNGLRYHGVTIGAELAAVPVQQLKRIPNFGPSSRAEIRTYLAREPN